MSNERIGPAEAGNLWRTEIALRVSELRNRLDAVCALDPDTGRPGDGHGQRPSEGGDVVAVAHVGAGGMEVAVGTASPPHRSAVDPAARACHIAAVREALADAEQAIVIRGGFGPWLDRIRAWWTGQRITAAWESVHRAEAELAAICSQDDALAVIPGLRAWMQQVLTDRQELACYERAFEDAVRARAIDRTVLRQAYEDTITANVDWHSSMRTFRNILFSVAAVLALLLLALAVWHAIDPQVVSLCRTVRSRTLCFGEHASPAGHALVLILLIGAVGGLLSSAFLLGKMESAPSRYNLLIPQLTLKAVTGAATALAGVILVQSHVLVAPVGGLSTGVMLAYALLFGFSQQLLTQYVDRRGVDLLKPQTEGRTARRR
jgi:hypothetical protein